MNDRAQDEAIAGRVNPNASQALSRGGSDGEAAAGCEKRPAGRSIRELEAPRHDFLVEFLALVQKYWPEAEGRPGRL